MQRKKRRKSTSKGGGEGMHKKGGKTRKRKSTSKGKKQNKTQLVKNCARAIPEKGRKNVQMRKKEVIKVRRKKKK